MFLEASSTFADIAIGMLKRVTKVMDTDVKSKKRSILSTMIFLIGDSKYKGFLLLNIK